MGVTWRWVCEARREQLELRDNKHPEGASDAVRIARACLFGPWRSQAVRLVSGDDPETEDLYFAAEDWPLVDER